MWEGRAATGHTVDGGHRADGLGGVVRSCGGEDRTLCCWLHGMGNVGSVEAVRSARLLLQSTVRMNAQYCTYIAQQLWRAPLESKTCIRVDRLHGSALEAGGLALRRERHGRSRRRVRKHSQWSVCHI